MRNYWSSFDQPLPRISCSTPNSSSVNQSRLVNPSLLAKCGPAKQESNIHPENIALNPVPFADVDDAPFSIHSLFFPCLLSYCLRMLCLWYALRFGGAPACNVPLQFWSYCTFGGIRRCCPCWVFRYARDRGLYPFASAWSYTVRRRRGLQFCCIYTRRQWQATRGYLLWDVQSSSRPLSSSSGFWDLWWMEWRHPMWSPRAN